MGRALHAQQRSISARIALSDSSRGQQLRTYCSTDFGRAHACTVAAGITADEDIAKGRKMEHTAFALDPGHSVCAFVSVSVSIRIGDS